MKQMSKTHKTMRLGVALFVAAAVIAPGGAMAKKKKKKQIELTKCEQSYGTVALVEGATQGWNKYGLGSPRGLIGAMASESGCFTLHNAASGAPADYLLNVIAGDKEEVDQSMSVAKAALSEGLLRSGAAGALLTKVPLGGSLMGMFGGFGGKKKLVAAGLRLISPANGQTLLVGSGEAKKSMITFNRHGAGWWAGAPAASAAAYSGSKNGKLMSTAFIKAYNQLVSQAGALASMPKAVAPAPEVAGVKVAVDTTMYMAASNTSSEVRALRADTDLTPTGNREGLFVEVKDNYGTQGWVSVEDLR